MDVEQGEGAMKVAADVKMDVDAVEFDDEEDRPYLEGSFVYLLSLRSYF